MDSKKKNSSFENREITIIIIENKNRENRFCEIYEYAYFMFSWFNARACRTRTNVFDIILKKISRTSKRFPRIEKNDISLSK